MRLSIGKISDKQLCEIMGKTTAPYVKVKFRSDGYGAAREGRIIDFLSGKTKTIQTSRLYMYGKLRHGVKYDCSFGVLDVHPELLGKRFDAFLQYNPNVHIISICITNDCWPLDKCLKLPTYVQRVEIENYTSWLPRIIGYHSMKIEVKVGSLRHLARYVSALSDVSDTADVVLEVPSTQESFTMPITNVKFARLTVQSPDRELATYIESILKK
jgi:hypothetical protein